MSDSEATDKSIWANLPPEIIAHVISLLPIKSLCRFRCVSPSWNSLISSPHFAQTLINRTNTNNPPKAILISSSRELYSVDFSGENPSAKKLHYPWTEHYENCVPLLNSCNGLVLVSYLGYPNFLLNPFTSEYKELPKSPFLEISLLQGSYYFLPGLGYDSYTNDYKVVMFPFRDIYSDSSESESESEFDGDASIADMAIYSLKIDAWRTIQASHYVSAHPVPGICFNERLHWLCWGTTGLGGCNVVAIDLADEISREVQAPPALSDDYNFMYNRMAVLGDCLSLLLWQLGEQKIDVWMMMKYGVGESWTKFTIADPMMSMVDVLCLSAEHEFVFATKKTIVDGNGVDGAKLFVYNPKKETLREMMVSGIPIRYTYGENYIETLVSPNHGGRIRRH